MILIIIIEFKYDLKIIKINNFKINHKNHQSLMIKKKKKNNLKKIFKIKK